MNKQLTFKMIMKKNMNMVDRLQACWRISNIDTPYILDDQEKQKAKTGLPSACRIDAAPSKAAPWDPVGMFSAE